jgi:hypothetical protein
MPMSLRERTHPGLGIIINFTARTVQGFGLPGSDSITFGKRYESSASMDTFAGNIDRVTGELRRFDTFYDVTSYSLQCRPAQRMF